MKAYATRAWLSEDVRDGGQLKWQLLALWRVAVSPGPNAAQQFCCLTVPNAGCENVSRLLYFGLHRTLCMQDVLPSNVADVLMTRKMDPQLRRVMTHSTSNNSTGYGRDRDAASTGGSSIALAAHHTGVELGAPGAAAASPSHSPAESPLSLTGLVGTAGGDAAASPHGSSQAASPHLGDSTVPQQAFQGVGTLAAAVVAVPPGLPPLHSHSSGAANATSGSVFGREVAQQQQQYHLTPTPTPRLGSQGGRGLLPGPSGSHGGSGAMGPYGGNGVTHVSAHGAAAGAAGGGPDSPAPRLGSTISGSGGAFLGTFGSTGDIVYK